MPGQTNEKVDRAAECDNGKHNQSKMKLPLYACLSGMVILRTDQGHECAASERCGGDREKSEIWTRRKGSQKNGESVPGGSGKKSGAAVNGRPSVLPSEQK